MSITLLHGDALTVLCTLPSGSVQTCITSPPYLGLRDYGTAAWEGGEAGCDHQYQKGGRNPGTAGKQLTNGGTLFSQYEHKCLKCGAIRVDDQIGLEATPEEYIAKLVAVFREVKRVLKDDGTLWLNIGDSYASAAACERRSTIGAGSPDASVRRANRLVGDLKEKDLMGIPWMLAFALRADGWYLRSEIIWHKPNPMPESVQDRPTKAHEQIFLLAKSAQYFYDAAAIAEPSLDPNDDRKSRSAVTDKRMPTAMVGGVRPGSATYPTRNKRDVWTVNSYPYPGAHFATFPPDLIEPCILAGTSERGECPKCGKAWVRVVEKSGGTIGKGWTNHKADISKGMSQVGVRVGSVKDESGKLYTVETVGWQPQCEHGLEPVPQTVIDIFNGSGTTGQVAIKHKRDYIGIDLSADYLDLTRNRLAGVQVTLFPIGAKASVK